MAHWWHCSVQGHGNGVALLFTERALSGQVVPRSLQRDQFHALRSALRLPGWQQSIDEAEHRNDGSLPHTGLLEDIGDRFGLGEDTGEELGAFASIDLEEVPARTEQAADSLDGDVGTLEVLRIDDEDSAWADEEMVDVSPTLRHAAVMQGVAHPVLHEFLEQPRQSFLALGADLPRVRRLFAVWIEEAIGRSPEGMSLREGRVVLGLATLVLTAGGRAAGPRRKGLWFACCRREGRGFRRLGDGHRQFLRGRDRRRVHLLGKGLNLRSAGDLLVTVKATDAFGFAVMPRVAALLEPDTACACSGVPQLDESGSHDCILQTCTAVVCLMRED